MKWPFLLILFILSGKLLAQNDSQNIRFYFGYEPSSTRINQSAVTFIGLRAGLVFNSQYGAGISYHFLRTRSKEDVEVNDQIKRMTRKYRFYSIYGEKMLISRKRWGSTAVTHLGIGETFLENEFEQIDFKTIFVLQPEITLHFNVTQWAGLNAALGFRANLSPEFMNTNSFSSGLFRLGVAIYPFEFYNFVVKEIKEEHGGS